MFNLVFTLLRLTLFSTLVLIGGSLIHWEGKTLSNRVEVRVRGVGSSSFVRGVTGWAIGLIKPEIQTQAKKTPSEQQKLKALLRELGERD
mgnify:CR=1 FL=1